MRKKYLSALLFGALLVTSAGTFTSCKDYDDEINNLQEQIDAVKASVADLEKKIEAGNWVTSVKDVEGGFEITFNDGNKYTIVNGEKGDKGDTGATGATGADGKSVSIKDGYWYIGDENTGWPVAGAKIEDGYWYIWQNGEWVKSVKAEGTVGEDGKSPYIGEDGYWYYFEDGDWKKGDKAAGTNGINGFSPYIDEDGFWHYKNEKGEDVTGPKAEGKDGLNGKSPFIKDGYWYYYDEEGNEVKGYAAEASMYVVLQQDRPCYTLFVLEKDAEGNDKEDYAQITLPTAPEFSASDMKLISIDNNEISDNSPVVTYFWGQPASIDNINGAGNTPNTKVLQSHKYRPTVYAQINPADVNFAAENEGTPKYIFKLKDSFGKELQSVEMSQYMSETPLSRAAQANKGIYQFEIDQNLLFAGSESAYALSTVNAYGNEILSGYDIKIATVNVDGSRTNQELKSIATLDLEVGTLYNLYDEVRKATKDADEQDDLDYVYQYKFAVTGADFDSANETIISNEAKTATVTLTYINLAGVKKTSIVTVNFAKSIKLGTKTIEFNKDLDRENPSNTFPDVTVYYKLDQEAVAIINNTDNSINATITLKDTEGSNLSVNGFAGELYQELSNNSSVKDADGDKLKKDNWYFKVTIQPETLAKMEIPFKFDLASSGGTVYATCNMTVNTSVNNNIFAYYAKEYWFDAAKENATVYGTPATGNKIKFDMFELFADNTTGTLVDVTATEQEHFKFEDMSDTTPSSDWFNASLNNHSLEIDRALISTNGEFVSHPMTAYYYPWGNVNLSPIKYEYNLKFASPFRQAEQKAVADVVFTNISETKSFPADAFDWIDPRTGDVFNWATDANVESMKLSIDSKLALYIGFGPSGLNVESGDFKTAGSGAAAILKFKDGTTSMPTSDVEGTMTLTVKDAWGVSTTQTVKVTLKK